MKQKGIRGRPLKPERDSIATPYGAIATSSNQPSGLATPHLLAAVERLRFLLPVPRQLRRRPADDVEDPDVLDDAVDELVNIVLDKGGKVVFVENGALEAHSRISLILRY